LQLGDNADFIVVDDLSNMKILATYINGVKVYDGEDCLLTEICNKTINNFFINNVKLDDLVVINNYTTVNVIEVCPNSLFTKKIFFNFNILNSFLESSIDNDVLKLVIVNRYKEARPSVAFIKGFGLKRGAIAATIAHDSHNIIAVGVDDHSIVTVIEELQNLQGGLALSDGISTFSLPLPIAGLMSNNNCQTVAEQYSQLSTLVSTMGSQLVSPFMTLSFMSLLVIPALKLSDKGLFDVSKFEFIPLQSE
jgi:adenine deaminase